MIMRNLAGLPIVALATLLWPLAGARADEAARSEPAPEVEPFAVELVAAEVPVAPAAKPDETPASAETKESVRESVRLAQTDVAPPRPGGTGPAGAPGPTSAPTGQPGAAPGTPGAPGAPGGMPPGAPPLAMILGFADFMLAIDRPFEAEKIYKQIQANMPKLDPTDPKVAEMMKNMPKEQLEGMKQAMAAVEKGMRDVEEAKKPTYTALAHTYYDDRDVELYAYGAGPTFRTRYGRITVTAGTGHYRNNNDPNNENNPLSLSPDIPTAEDNDTLRKRTFNLLLEPYYKKWEGNLFFSNVTYDSQPDRFLYDLKLSYVPNPARERYYISHGRHDSYFQNVNNQFFAPETFFQIKKKILYDDYSFGIEYPLGKRIDSAFYHRYFEYTDGNRRTNYRTTLMYRLKPTGQAQMPVWRVGLDFIWDDSKFFTLDYTASENFNAYSIATDYMWISRKLKYGFYASYPIAEQNFTAPYGVFGFASYQLTKNAEVYSKLARLSGAGNSLTFNDFVFGVNVRF